MKPCAVHVSGVSKKTASSVLGLRGAKLVKKAIEAGRSEALADPEPVAPAVLKKLVLPNGEPISAAMKELLKVDALWLGIEFDEDEGDIESTSLEELVEDELGKPALATFNEAIEMLSGDCIPLGGVSEAVRFLYVGEADESGEYPVVFLVREPKPWVGGFVPFDVWLAQELGALDPATSPGAVPAEYEEAAKALAEANGDGRVGFEPIAGERSDEDEGESEDDEDDDEDEDEGEGEGEDDADVEEGEEGVEENEEA